MTRAWPQEHGVLQIGGLSIEILASQFETPLFVTDAARVQQCYQQLVAAFAPYAPVTIAYACKANAALGLLQVLEREGAWLDVVSPGEAFLALHAGFPAERLYFTGTNPRDDELEWLVQHGITCNLDSLSMARRLAPLLRAANLGVRVNPRVGAGHHEHVITGAEDSKFGVHAQDLPAVCAVLRAHGHRLTRLHAHIGSGIMEPAPYLVAIDELARVAAELREPHGMPIDTVDIGGGFGIPYHPEEVALDVAAMAGAIGERFRAHFGPAVHLILEPGRYLVADSTLLLTRVNTIKPTPQHCFVGVDAGMQLLTRIPLYEAYHHIVAATKLDQPATHRYEICGPICETGDVLGRDRALPPLAEGDLLAICDTGAYGFAMASTYNGRPLPAEVLVHDGRAQLLRAREGFADLLRGQCQIARAP